MAQRELSAGGAGTGAVRALVIAIGAVVIASLPALILRFTGMRFSPVLDAVLFGIALLAAGFMLSWGAETAEQDVSQGLVLAVLALVTVLPEYAVDLYFAYQAGRDPGGPYSAFAMANMTGANRLLIGVAWPLMGLLFWARGGGTMIRLARGNTAEIVYLALATVYSFVIYIKRTLTLIDLVVLVAIFAAYLIRQSKRELPEAGANEERQEIGPAAVLLKLPNGPQWAAITALTLFAAGIILASAEPFAESLVASGSSLGINQFLLIQWLAPLASEAPAVILAALFAIRLRASNALATLISDKINQWTLLVGMIPLLFSIGAGRFAQLNLSDRQLEEFFLTAAQSVFAVSILMRLRLSIGGSLALLGLFVLQFALGFIFRDDEARTIQVLTAIAWLYLVLSAGLILWNRAALARLFTIGLLDRHEPNEPTPPHAQPPERAEGDRR